MTLVIPHIQDPGNGWFVVPLHFVKSLSIRPSRHSFHDSHEAFLSEDHDGPVMLATLDAARISYQIREYALGKDAPCRAYTRFAGNRGSHE